MVVLHKQFTVKTKKKKTIKQQNKHKINEEKNESEGCNVVHKFMFYLRFKH